MDFGVNITCNDECIAFEDNRQFRAENRLHRYSKVNVQIA